MIEILVVGTERIEYIPIFTNVCKYSTLLFILQHHILLYKRKEEMIDGRGHNNTDDVMAVVIIDYDDGIRVTL